MLKKKNEQKQIENQQKKAKIMTKHWKSEKIWENF